MLGAGMPPTCGVVFYAAWNAKCGDGVLASCLGPKHQRRCHIFTSSRSSLCHKLCSSCRLAIVACNLLLRPVGVSRQRIKRSSNVLPTSHHPLAVLSLMEFQTNGFSFLPDMREDAADPSSPLFSAHSPAALPSSPLFQPLFPPFGQDFSRDFFPGHASPQSESELSFGFGFQDSGLFPPPPT